MFNLDDWYIEKFREYEELAQEADVEYLTDLLHKRYLRERKRREMYRRTRDVLRKYVSIIFPFLGDD